MKVLLLQLILSSLMLPGSSSLSLPSQTVNAGSEAVLPCSLEAQQEGNCHWLRSSPVEISVPGKPRMETMELGQGESVKVLCQNDAVDQSVKLKWFINEKQISGEESDMLEITKFAKIYDKTVIKCAKENAEGGDEILRIVRLIYNPHKLIPLPVTTTSVKSNKKQTFLCVSAIVEATEPKYILIEGKHGKDQHSEYNFVSKDKNYKCKEVRNGTKNLVDISRELNVMNRKIKKFSRNLEETYG